MENYLPILEVNDDNFQNIFPTIVDAIENSSFVAIDCELTGIGDRKKINCPEMDLRYQYTAEVARNYAVISFGLSCFIKSVTDINVEDEGDAVHTHDYMVQTFDVLTLCSEPFTVECTAHKFLIRHGFDFNKLYTKGLAYYKGCDKEDVDKKRPNVRHLFSTIVKHKKPVVIHNGLMDLVFLYQSFYAELPKDADTFAADLSEMFPCGIYDTKYMAEFHQTMPATFLEYLYKKTQLNNAYCRRRGNWHVQIYFTSYERGVPHVDWYPYLQIHDYNFEKDDDGLALCDMFAYHGWCSEGEKCYYSHDINKIVRLLSHKGAKRRGKSKYSGPKSASLVQIIQEAAKKKTTKAISDKAPTKKQKLSNEKFQNMNKFSEVVPENMNNLSKVVPKNMNKLPEVGPKNMNKVSEVGPKNMNKLLEVASKNKNKFSEVGPLNKTHHHKVALEHRASGHRSGFDAFMTGFIFAFHISQNGKLRENYGPFTSDRIGLTDQVNKVYLMGKNFPFLIRTGTYANSSTNHLNKIKTLWEIKEPKTIQKPAL